MNVHCCVVFGHCFEVSWWVNWGWKRCDMTGNTMQYVHALRAVPSEQLGSNETLSSRGLLLELWRVCLMKIPRLVKEWYGKAFWIFDRNILQAFGRLWIPPDPWLTATSQLDLSSWLTMIDTCHTCLYSRCIVELNGYWLDLYALTLSCSTNGPSPCGVHCKSSLHENENWSVRDSGCGRFSGGFRCQVCSHSLKNFVSKPMRYGWLDVSKWLSSK